LSLIDTGLRLVPLLYQQTKDLARIYGFCQRSTRFHAELGVYLLFVGRVIFFTTALFLVLVIVLEMDFAVK
jgi:hypothetical protein